MTEERRRDTDVTAELIQKFIEQLTSLRGDMQGVLQASRDTAGWVANLDKNLHEELERSRALDHRLSTQEKETSILFERMGSADRKMDDHMTSHKWFMGLILGIPGAVAVAYKITKEILK